MVEIFEQIQLKSELAKDLEKQRLSYRHWLNVEGVDQEASIRYSMKLMWFIVN